MSPVFTWGHYFRYSLYTETDVEDNFNDTCRLRCNRQEWKIHGAFNVLSEVGEGNINRTNRCLYVFHIFAVGPG